MNLGPSSAPDSMCYCPLRQNISTVTPSEGRMCVRRCKAILPNSILHTCTPQQGVMVLGTLPASPRASYVTCLAFSYQPKSRLTYYRFSPSSVIWDRLQFLWLSVSSCMQLYMKSVVHFIKMCVSLSLLVKMRSTAGNKQPNSDRKREEENLLNPIMGNVAVGTEPVPVVFNQQLTDVTKDPDP